MRKNVFGRQFKRDANERKALFKNLLTSLVLHERIQTTEAKAKAIKGAADKLVTKAKRGGIEAQLLLQPDVHYKAVVKLINDIAPRFTSRQGGYTRIIKTHRRVADNAEMVLMEWVEKPLPVVKTEKSEKSKVKSGTGDKKKSKVEKKVASNANKNKTETTSSVANKKEVKSSVKKAEKAKGGKKAK